MKRSIATPEAPTTAPLTNRKARPTPVAAVASRWAVPIGPLGLAGIMWVAVALMVYALLATPVDDGNRGLMNLTESVGALERTALWQRAFSWLPGVGSVSWSPLVLNWTVRISLIVLFVVHVLAFWRCWNGAGGVGNASLLRWLVGPIGAHLLMIGFLPTSADVFYYAMSGDLANNGANPYAYPLIHFPENPLYPYNHWVDMTAVYGPIWTAINQALVAVTGNDPVAAVVGFKIFLGAVAIGLALLVFWLAKQLTGSRQLALAAGVFVAWQPNLIVETSGQAHNDVVMLLLAIAGLALALLGGQRGVRGALVLLAASVAVKYVTLPLLGLVGLLRLAELRRTGAAGLTRAWLLDGLAVLAVWIAAFAPYWVGPNTFAEMVTEPGRNFSNPLWLVPYLLSRWTFGKGVDPIFYGGLRALMVVVTLGFVLWVAYRFGRHMVERAPRRLFPTIAPAVSDLPWWTGALLIACAATLGALAFLPVNTHAWYSIWPVAPVALLVALRASSAPVDGVGPTLPRWFWAYLVFSALVMLIYHTRVVHI